MKNLFISLFLLVAGMAIGDDHAPVGIRTMSDEVLKELSVANDTEKGEEPNSTGDSLETEEQAGYRDCDYFPEVPDPNHWIMSISPFGHSIEIEDGSVWQVSHFDTRFAHHWRPGDIVIITQNQSWFSSNKYRMTNKNNGKSISVSLSLGPVMGGEHTLQITNIDHVNGLLILSDCTHWKISSRDHYLFHEWALGDYIILGINSGWDASCPFILINSNMNNLIRVKQY